MSRVSIGTFFQLGYGCSKLLVNMSTIAWTGSTDGMKLYIKGNKKIQVNHTSRFTTKHQIIYNLTLCHQAIEVSFLVPASQERAGL